MLIFSINVETFNADSLKSQKQNSFKSLKNTIRSRFLLNQSCLKSGPFHGRFLAVILPVSLAARILDCKAEKKEMFNSSV
ncbi:hypothetical protein BpHYR1_032773 [Brachionus plicatilis]|uniref:Uncharacterized protein n=1 Tax=Brachionus plicatilis TaxID=10195 RepID=A0A3M7QWW2_BRAPC|nr:hypothetical protein BpHYR1_032773 [Brachionus plicatilis]